MKSERPANVVTGLERLTQDITRQRTCVVWAGNPKKLIRKRAGSIPALFVFGLLRFLHLQVLKLGANVGAKQIQTEDFPCFIHLQRLPVTSWPLWPCCQVIGRVRTGPCAKRTAGAP